MIEESDQSVRRTISYPSNIKNETSRDYLVTYSRPLCAAFPTRTSLGMAVERFVFPSRQPIPDSSAATFTASIYGVNYRTKLVSSLKIE